MGGSKMSLQRMRERVKSVPCLVLRGFGGINRHRQVARRVETEAGNCCRRLRIGREEGRSVGGMERAYLCWVLEFDGSCPF